MSIEEHKSDKHDQKILDSNKVENQNKGHNVQKQALGPNTKQ